MSGFSDSTRRNPVELPVPLKMAESPEENNWRALARSQHAVVNLRREQMPSLQVVCISEQIVSIRVSRVERHGGREVSLGLSPIVAAPVDVT